MHQLFAVDVLNVRGALDLLQLLLWAEGFLCLLGVPALARIAWHQGGAPWLDFNLVYSIAVAALAPFVAWGILQRQRWAWPLGLLHGLLQLPVLPFLTPLGIVELAALALPDTRRYLNQASPRSPTFPWLRAATFGVGLAWIGYCGWAGVEFLNRHQLPAWPAWHLLWVVPLLVLIDVAVHELGHVAGGWLAGFRFQQICVGPLVIHRLRDGWSWTLDPARLWQGGFAGAVPDDVRHMRVNLLLFVAGGPLASFLLAAACGLLFLTSPGSPWAGYAEPLGILGAWSWVTCLVSLTPTQSRSLLTDGAWLGELAAGTRQAMRHCALYAMSASEHNGLRPAAWHHRWLEQALAPADPSTERVAALVAAYVHFLDRGDLARAGRYLDEAVTLQHRLPPGPVTRLLWLERAYFLARHRHDARSARDAWERALTGLPVEQALLLRAECALLAAEGDTRTASDLLAAARALLPQEPRSGMAAFEAGRLEELARAPGPRLLT